MLTSRFFLSQRQLILLLLSLFISHVNAFAQKTTAAQTFQTAYRVYQHNDYEAALQGFQQFAAQSPTHLLQDYAYFYRGIAHLRLQHYEQARKMFTSLRSTDAKSRLAIDAKFFEADSWFYQGDCPTAIQRYRVLQTSKASKNHRLIPESLLKLGQCYEQQQQAVQALGTYHQARLRYVASPIYAQAKAHEERILSDVPPAEKYYSTQRLFKSSDVLIKSGKARDALPLLRRLRQHALSAAEEEKFALLQAYAYYILRENIRAKAHYRQFLREYPKSKSVAYVLDRIGRIYLRQGDMAGFLRTYTVLLQEHPKSHYTASAIRLKGKEFQLLGDFSSALDEFTIFATRFPKDSLMSDVLWNTGWCHYQLRHYKSALQAFDRFVNVYRKSSLKEEALYWAGRSAEASQQRARAVGYYQKIITANRVSFFSRMAQQALAHIQQADPNSVVPAASQKLKSLEFEKTAVFSTHQGKLHQKKAAAFLDMQLYELAAEEFAYAVEHEKSDNTRYLALAQLYRKAGRYHELARLMQNHFWYWIIYGGDDLPQAFWELAYPRSYDRIVTQYAEQNGIDPFLVQSLMFAESAFDPHAFSPAGAMGLMQLMPYTGKRLAQQIGMPEPETESYFTPDVNVRLGITYLRDLSQLFTQQLPPVIASYNAGEHRVQEWWKDSYAEDLPQFVAMIPYKETKGYVQKVLWYYQEYQRIYRGK